MSAIAPDASLITGVIEERVMKQIKTDISNCRLKGLMVEPFIAAPAMEMMPNICRVASNGQEVKTAAVSGRMLYVNPEFWNSLVKAERIGLFMHEVWHVALGHHLRRGNRNVKLWNIACDYHINLLLIEAGFSLPDGGLVDTKYTGWSEERIYQHLWDNALIINVPQGGTQHIDPDMDQGQGGGAVNVIVEGEVNEQQVPGDGADGSDDKEGSSSSGDDGSTKDESASEEGDGSGAEEGEGDSEEDGGITGESGDGSGEEGDGDEAEGSQPSGADSDGSGDEGGSSGDVSGGDSESSGDKPAEPDAQALTNQGEASVVSKHADAYNDVPWGEVWDAEDEDGQVLDEKGKRDALQDLKQDLQMAKNMNHVSAGSSGRVFAQRTVQNLVSPNTDWSHMLRMFFSKNGNPSGRSYHALDRRGLQLGRYEPAVIKDSVDWTVCFWDVSISMDWPSHRALLSQLARIRKTVSIQRLTILPFNSRALVDSIVELGPRDPLPQSFNIGGGTSFNAPFIWLNQQDGTPDGVVVFTDLGSTVTVPRPNCDVLWLSSEPVYVEGGYPGYPEYTNRPAFGKVVEIKLN